MSDINVVVKQNEITVISDRNVSLAGEKGDKGDTGDTALLTTTETITVGTGGQFSTINAALAYATKKYPTYVSASVRPRVTINLLSGFVMAEQVYVDGLDLGWITISSVDAEVTIQRSALTTTYVTGNPAFAIDANAISPIINVLFNMDTSGTASSRHGIVVKGSRASIESGKGFKNCGGNGLHAIRSAIVKAYNSNFSGSGVYGIYADQASIISAYGANVSYAYTSGVYATGASTIEFASGNAQRAGYAQDDTTILNASADGIYAHSGSTINAASANASNSTRYGVFAQYNSRINFNSGTATNTGNYSVYSRYNSVIHASSSNCSGIGAPEYAVVFNSQIDITSATGDVATSPAINSYTNAGLITNNSGVITTSGSLPLTGGTLTGLLTTNGQIKFPATQNPSSDANTLDDYEEGTFTPTVSFATTTGTIAYTAQQGKYVKIGKLVTVFWKITFSQTGSSGFVKLGGFPFTVQGNPSASGATYTSNLTSVTGTPIARADNGNTFAYLYQIVNGSASPIGNSNIVSSDIEFTMSYNVA